MAAGEPRPDAAPPLDFGAYRREIPPAEVRRLLADNGIGATGLSVAQIVLDAVLVAASVLLLVLGVVQASGSLAALAVGPLVLGAVFTLFSRFQNLRRGRHIARVQAFAVANGFDYRPETVRLADELARGAQVFRQGDNRRSSELLSGRRAVPFRVFGFSYETHSTDSNGRRTTTVHRLGGIRVDLARALPPIWGRSAQGGRFLREDGLPHDSVAHGRRLELEGDFPTHFEVRTRDGLEADALYVLAPDVMADLVDHAGDFDFEVIGPYLFFTSQDPFALHLAADVARAFEVIDTVGARIGRIAERYTPVD